MDNKKLQILSFALFLILQFTSLRLPSLAFTPTDHYLINCGSTATITVEGRDFVDDSTFLSSRSTKALTDPNPSSSSLPLYQTARVFTRVSSYKFDIKEKGIHVVRLHFFPFSSSDHDLRLSFFYVSVPGSNLYSEFRFRDKTHTSSPLLKEYILMIQNEKLEILFAPAGEPFLGFVNAIEVFSAPPDLISNRETNAPRFVRPSGIEDYMGLQSRVLETIHRINVGGPKITPFNDTLWRTWIPDEDFLVLKSAAKVVPSGGGPLNYVEGFTSEEIAPESVYLTAQEMNKSGKVGEFNITWAFPPTSGSGTHLVRMHFCDIVSTALDMLYFNVYINDYLAYKDLDLSTPTQMLMAAYYVDFVVDMDNSSRSMHISVGPSEKSGPEFNAILNGVEIMKIMDGAVSSLPGVPKNKNVAVLVGSVVGGVSLVCACIVMFTVVVLKRRKKKKRQEAKLSKTGSWFHTNVSEGTNNASPRVNMNLGLKIPLAEIQLSTNNFDKNLVIGSGGFGVVYKGVLRGNMKVAVKRAIPGSRQGIYEFQTEITLLSKIRHRHLVSLIGYCDELSEMILVYEYMEKGPLKNHLYGSGLPPLNWIQRLEICIGSARGLHYLHTGVAQVIIHRDVKSTNVLLDENYVAKVADFGLSKPGPCVGETHVSTTVKGSFGYLDPEYFRSQQLTDKSDVYSFGVLLLELLCARPAIDPLLSREQVKLAEWAMKLRKKGQLEQIIDPHLLGQINTNCFKKFEEIAAKCLADFGINRPTMGDVLWDLEYALQLQQIAVKNEPHEDSIHHQWQLPLPTVVLPSSDTFVEGDSDWNFHN